MSFSPCSAHLETWRATHTPLTLTLTPPLSVTPNPNPNPSRNVESYSQLREAAKLIIARVAGRLSGVRLGGLMDPAVTGLERAAVVANTPITFKPRELLGVSQSAALRIPSR